MSIFSFHFRNVKVFCCHIVYQRVLNTPLGCLRLTASVRGLTGITFLDHTAAPGPEHTAEAALLDLAADQVLNYFAGQTRVFTIPFEACGTSFQLAVWREIAAIPYGRTATYGELARRLGSVNMARAVGRAAGANPLPIVIPCHRVIGADGSLTGFSAGLERKRFLLELEGKNSASENSRY